MVNKELIGKEVLILVGCYQGVWGTVTEGFNFDTDVYYIIALWNNPDLKFPYKDYDFRILGKDEVIL